MSPLFERYRSRTASGVFLRWALFMETVLIVEDKLTTRDMLVELLGKDGRAIVTAGDGQEALERLTEVPRPCMILRGPQPYRAYAVSRIRCDYRAQ